MHRIRSVPAKSSCSSGAVQNVSRVLVSVVCAVIVLLGCQRTACAQGWVISGSVTDGAGLGIPNVALDLFEAATGVQVLGLSGDVSGLDGTFGFTVLDVIPVGFYDLEFSPPASSHFIPATRQFFFGGSTSTGVTALESGWFVSGRVVDDFGVGIDQVDLNVYEASSGILIATSGDVTDALGQYSILILPSSYDIEFRATATTPGGPYVPVRIESLPVFADVALGDAVFRAGYPLTGLVHDAAGQPIVGADIDVIHPATGERVFTPGDNTDVAGFFSVLAPLGSFTVEIDPPVGLLLVARLLAIVVVSPATSLGIITLPDGFSVSGTTVSPSLSPVANVDLDFVVTATQVEAATAHDNADAFGNFSVVVEPDTYDILFRPPFLSGFTWLRMNAVVVAESLSLGSVVLPVGIAITGNVSGGGSPVENVAVTVSDATTGLPVYAFGNRTDFLGQYAIRELAGTYDLQFTPPAGSGFASTEVTAVVVATDTVVNIELAPLALDLFVRGDANADGSLNVADAIWILNFIFQSGTPPPCFKSSDANDDGGLNIADAIWLIGYFFVSGAPPPSPFPTCGADPSLDGLTCATYVPCAP